MKTKLFLLFAAALLFAVSVQAQKIQSVYTTLDDRKCKTLESNPNEGGSYLGECPGTGGYKLRVAEGDLRQTVSVVAPNKKVFPLELWTFFSGFSAVQQNAEWRVKGKTPIAVIVRFNVSENPEDSSKTSSYLIVSKITKGETCVVETFKPGKAQNILARQAADSAASKPCKSPE